MKLLKYNLAYNTRDQLQSLAISASERKISLKSKIDDRRDCNCYKYTICAFIYQTHTSSIPNIWIVKAKNKIL